MSGAAPKGADDKEIPDEDFDAALEAFFASDADKEPVMARESGVHETGGAGGAATLDMKPEPMMGGEPDAKETANAPGAEIKLEDLLSGKLHITKEMAKDEDCRETIMSGALTMDATKLQAKVVLAIMHRFQEAAKQTDSGEKIVQMTGELAKAQAEASAKSAELEELKKRHQELIAALDGSVLGARHEGQTFELSPSTAGNISYSSPFKLAGAKADDKNHVDEASTSGNETRDAKKLIKYAQEGRKSVMTDADRVAFEENTKRLAKVLSGLGTASNGGIIMPQLLTQVEIQKLCEKVRKKADERCSQKLGVHITSEAKVLEHVLRILEESNVDMPILQRALRAESYGAFVEAYEAGYRSLTQASLSEQQLAKMSFAQYKDTAISQNDKVLIAVVEAGLSKMSQTLAARCNTSTQNRSVASGSGERLSDSKQQVGAGLMYILEATMHLCRSSWDTVLRDFLDVMDSAYVLEDVCNGSIERVMIEMDKIYDWFERKNGTINREMLQGMSTLIILDKIKKNKTSHLAESLQSGLKLHKFDPTQRDLKGALVEAKKAVELLTLDEKKHADAEVRCKVELELRNLRKALDKHRGAKTEMAHQASESDAKQEYHKGIVAGAGALLLSREASETIMAVSHEESKKRLADEAQLMGNMLNRVLDLVKKVEDGKGLDARDNEKMSALLKQLKGFKDIIDGTSRAPRQGQGAARRGRSTTRGASSERKPASEIDCVYWKQGNCKKGEGCAFRHDAQKKGSDPQALIKRFARAKSNERESENAHAAADAPDCRNPDCSAKAMFDRATGKYFNYCRFSCMKDHKEKTGPAAMAANAGEESDAASAQQYDDYVADISRTTGIVFAGSVNVRRDAYVSTASTALQAAGPKGDIVPRGEYTQRMGVPDDTAQMLIADDVFKDIMGCDIIEKDFECIRGAWSEAAPFSENIDQYVWAWISQDKDPTEERMHTIALECERRWDRFCSERRQLKGCCTYEQLDAEETAGTFADISEVDSSDGGHSGVGDLMRAPTPPKAPKRG